MRWSAVLHMRYAHLVGVSSTAGAVICGRPAVESDLAYDKSQCCGSTLFATKMTPASKAPTSVCYPDSGILSGWLFVRELMTSTERFGNRNTGARHRDSGARGGIIRRASRHVGSRRRGCFGISINGTTRISTRSLVGSGRGDNRDRQRWPTSNGPSSRCTLGKKRLVKC